ncbi:hypothetical protein ALQ64_101795 [Pseudomonas cannabina]|uniref:3-carboxy-cis,cis-muconate cycloisomerase n=1 Tax=Pseudomonas cannabina TaxID=86840 RepID=A0A0P9KGW8_PSECA|nr:hypothetical protein ALO81_101631 [Pseudomonas cannabina]RMN33697.1 hypothetical protein ALQ64_101795 [Pseudomonas cannabina]
MSRPGNQLFDAYFTQADMREIFSDQGRVQGMLDFEAALARAQARVGLIPASVVADIEQCCRPNCSISMSWRSPSAALATRRFRWSRRWAGRLPHTARKPSATCTWARPARM